MGLLAGVGDRSRADGLGWAIEWPFGPKSQKRLEEKCFTVLAAGGDYHRGIVRLFRQEDGDRQVAEIRDAIWANASVGLNELLRCGGLRHYRSRWSVSPEFQCDRLGGDREFGQDAKHQEAQTVGFHFS